MASLDGLEAASLDGLEVTSAVSPAGDAASSAGSTGPSVILPLGPQAMWIAFSIWTNLVLVQIGPGPD